MFNMDLFCFTLEGSTESIYEAVKKPNLKEALPKNQNSCESLSCKAEWDSSDPSDKHQTVTRSKGENSRSYQATLMLENETFAGNESGVLTRQVQEKETVSERNRTHLLTEHSDLLTDSDESSQTVGRLKKLQKLVPLKTSPQNDGDNDGSTAKKHDCLVEGIRRNSIALTCISLSGRTEKSSYKAAAASEPLQLPENTRSSHEDPIEGEFWIPKIGHYTWKPFERPEAWPPCQHICQQNPDGLCVHDGNSSFLSWNSDWDRFESLIQELDRRQSDLSLSQMVRPPADLQPLKIPEKETGLKSEGREMETSKESDPNYINISPEKTQAAQNVSYA
ncbi:uncharacterized protein LOC119788069 [Cyprinodon tularosa]|uniref:uncharacterized protein LOC119788069 n=1 Tax=Cyprinodon tularosa TaxID=77115 RepID=UPI0018E1ECAE|nr:uncharacterized protein LOC119788069 [Cyprinodon tularosa]